jgi:L-2,4-diaminobutyric acid acetyltransferase
MRCGLTLSRYLVVFANAIFASASICRHVARIASRRVLPLQIHLGFVSVFRSPLIDHENSSSLDLRSPTSFDGAAIWQLVHDSGVLDINSRYAYLLLTRDFASTCVVAQRRVAGAQDEAIVGFLSAYFRPEHLDTLFVWQVGVSRDARRQGLGRRMLEHLLSRDVCRRMKYLEATVSESNVASRRLFQSLARDRSVPFAFEAGFDADLFGSDQHEPEPLMRIGPFPAVT